jgi:hypothetical protein
MTRVSRPAWQVSYNGRYLNRGAGVVRVGQNMRRQRIGVDGQKPYAIFRRCAWILRELQTHSGHGHTGMILATQLPYIFLRSFVEPHHAKSWVLFA